MTVNITAATLTIKMSHIIGRGSVERLRAKAEMRMRGISMIQKSMAKKRAELRRRWRRVRIVATGGVA